MAMHPPFPRSKECIWYADKCFQELAVDMEEEEPIPDIDFSSLLKNINNNQSLGEKVRSAAMEGGVFRVSNHGIPEDLLSRVLQHSRRFFNLPLHLKDKNKHNHKEKERERQETETESTETEKEKEKEKERERERETETQSPESEKEKLRETEKDKDKEKEKEREKEKEKEPKKVGFVSRYTSSSSNASGSGSLESLQVVSGRQNIKEVLQTYWPHQTQYQQMWDDLDEYTQLLGKLGHIILEFLFMGFNIKDPIGEIAKIFGEGRLRMNHYSPSESPNASFGAKPHADFSAITILLQDDVGGLQYYKGGRWVGVKPKPNTLVVNVADIVQVLSNCRYISPVHRVVVNTSKDRFSLAFTYFPLENAIIKVFDDILSPNSPPKYKPFTREEYISNFSNALQQKHSAIIFYRVSF